MDKICSECKLPHPIDEFGSYGFLNRCKECAKKYFRDWHRKNSNNVHKRLGPKYYQHAINCFSYFLSHPCVDCGEVNPLKLVFDHVRGEKKFEIMSKLMTSYTWEMIEEEIKKCDVRCNNCHVKRHGVGNYRERYLRGDYVKSM